MRNILLTVAALAVCAAAVWLVLDEGPVRDDGPVSSLSSGIEADSSRVSAPAANGPRAEATELLPLLADPPAVDSPLPESYRQALGGLKGRVVEEDGTPVPALTVALVGADFFDFMKPLDLAPDDPQSAFDPLMAEVVTDAQGRFFAGDLETRVIGGLIADPNGARASVHVLDYSPSTGVVHDLGDIVLAGGVTLRGRLIDERSEPIAGARVRALPLSLPPGMFPEEIVDLRPEGGLMIDTGSTALGSITYRLPGALWRLERLLPLPTTQTDANGEWLLDGVPSGAPLMLFDDGVHVSRARSTGPTGPTGSEVEMDDLMLFDGVTLRGRVVDSQGDPVPGAEVLAGNRMGLGAPVAILHAPVTADENGRFAVSGLRPNQAHAVARKSEHDEFTASESVLAGSEEAVVELTTGRELQLLLIGADGERLTGAEIRGRALPDDDANEAPEFLFPSRPLQAQTSVNEDTEYTVVSDLSATYWELTLQVDDHAVHREVFDLREGDLRTELRLQLERSVRLRVVRASDGEPVEHAYVAAADANSRGFTGDRPLTGGRTSAEGYVELSGLIDGEASFTTTHPAYAVTRVEARVPLEEDLVIELPVGGRILGQVFENGEVPVEPVMLMLNTRGGPDVAEAPRFAVSDLDGLFTFTNVQPGKATVEARERIGSLNLASPIDNFFVSELARAEVEVEAETDHEVVMVLGSGADGIETGRVAGRLRVNGVPVQGWHLRTWGKLRRSATSAEDGSFDLGLLAAGSVSIMISPPGRNFMNGASSYTEQLELSASDERWVDIDFDVGMVSGIVLDDQTGAPVPGTPVVARAVQDGGNEWFGGRYGTSVTDNEGYFEITDLSAGTYTANTDLKGYAKTISEEFEVGPGRAQQLVLRMSKGWIVSGQLVTQGVSDEPPRWMWLTAEANDGREAAARPDKDMSFRFDDLAAGDWTFRLLSSHDVEFQPVSMRLDYARENLQLVFVPEEPEPVAAEALQKLEELGYQ
ncbi:MAG: hypothetical protein DHS20C15_20490 [Planctomycetota bacterium]|nr:MAG: hypothetical protein DHS20C15_20490 [Planctomycetota bacterium]